MKLNKLRTQANEKGFTLIELMIVIAIIGILAAVAIPNFIAYRDKAFCSSAEADAASIAANFADYFAIPTHTSLFSNATGGDGNIATSGVATGLLGTAGNNTTAKFGQLSGQNVATVSGSIDNIVISVRDMSDRCPSDYQAANAEWTDNLYTKSME